MRRWRMVWGQVPCGFTFANFQPHKSKLEFICMCVCVGVRERVFTRLSVHVHSHMCTHGLSLVFAVLRRVGEEFSVDVWMRAGWFVSFQRNAGPNMCECVCVEQRNGQLLIMWFLWPKVNIRMQHSGVTSMANDGTEADGSNGESWWSLAV